LSNIPVSARIQRADFGLILGIEAIVYGKLKVPKVASKNTQYCRWKIPKIATCKITKKLLSLNKKIFKG